MFCTLDVAVSVFRTLDVISGAGVKAEVVDSARAVTTRHSLAADVDSRVARLTRPLVGAPATIVPTCMT